MKKLLVCVLFFGALYPLRAATIPIFYDSFGYSPVGAQVSSAGAPAWSLRSAAGSVDPKIAPGSLSYPGLQTASGDNSVVFDGIAPAAGISGRVLDQTYNISNAPTLYYSLTLQVSSITTGDWGGSANWLTGSFMLGFSQNTTGALNQGDTAAPLLIRTGDPNNTSGTANDFPGFQLGTGVTAVSAIRTFDGAHTYLPGTTLFLVLSYTFGPNAMDDVAKLWVNPIPGSLESTNIPVVTTAAGVAADVLNSQIQAFYLRNNSVEPQSTLIDDLRVGTSWADVTPLGVPEPSSLALTAVCAAGLLHRRLRR